MEDGQTAKYFDELANMGTSHFRSLFKAPSEASIVEVIRVGIFFPRYVEEDENENIMMPVTKGEVEGILKDMQKDKILGPQAWMVELFQHFFETLGEELIEVVE